MTAGRVESSGAAKSAGTTAKIIQKSRGKSTATVQGQSWKLAKPAGATNGAVRSNVHLVADALENKQRTVSSVHSKQSAVGDEKKAAKAKVQARVVARTGRSDVGVTLKKRDSSKYKALFDKMKMLESKDAEFKEQKPVPAKPQTPKRFASEEPKKKVKTASKLNPTSDKKKKTEKVKEKIKQKEKRSTTVGAKPDKPTKVKATGKILKPTSIIAKPIKKVLKLSTPPRSVSRSVEISEKSVEQQKTIQKSVHSSKKRTLDPRDAIPKFEKFVRKPRAHTDSVPVPSPTPKQREQKPKKVIKNVVTVVETAESEVVERKRSPQKIAEPVRQSFGTPQQTKHLASEKKSAKLKSQRREPIVDDIGLEDMLGSSSKAPIREHLRSEPAGFCILTSLVAASPEREQMDEEIIEESEVVESPPKRSPAKERFSSQKKASLQKSVAKEASPSKGSIAKEWNQPSHKSSHRKASPEPIIEVEQIVEETTMLEEKIATPIKVSHVAIEASPVRESSPVKEAHSVIDPSPVKDASVIEDQPESIVEEDVDEPEESEKANSEQDDDDVVEVEDELDDFAMAMLSSSKNKQENSERKASRYSSGNKNEPASLGLLTSSFGGDQGDDNEDNDQMDEEEIAEAEEYEEADQEEGNTDEDQDEDEQADDVEDMVEEDVVQEVQVDDSSHKQSVQEQPEDDSAHAGDQAHEIEDQNGVQEVEEVEEIEEVEQVEQVKEKKTITATTSHPPPLFRNQQHSMFSNPTGALFGSQAKQDVSDVHRPADKAASESSVESKIAESSKSSAYGDHEENNAARAENDHDGDHVNLEPLSSEPRDNGMMFNKVDEEVPMNLDTTVQRSRTETPDKAFHDSSLDHHKLNSNSKQNDGTDFSFY